MVTPAARREAVSYLRSAHEMSERRAIRVIGADRSAVRYRSTRPDDTALRDRLKSLALERRRFGYRRLHVLLRRDGHVVNHKRVQRLYREEKLTVRRRGGRKRALGERRPLETPTAANQRWSLDFVADQFTDGRRFRILEVYDDCTRECLALVPDTSISGGGWRANWTPSSPGAESPRRLSATTARNSRRTPSSNGPRSRKSGGITSPRASLSRTASAKASTGVCGMSA